MCLLVPGMQGKNIFTQESFYLQSIRILNDINEQDTSFLDCKHKHMMKSGLHLTKSESSTICIPVEFYGFTSIIDL